MTKCFAEEVSKQCFKNFSRLSLNIFLFDENGKFWPKINHFSKWENENIYDEIKIILLKIPITTSGFERGTSYVRCRYLNLMVSSGLSIHTACTKFSVYINLWSQEFYSQYISNTTPSKYVKIQLNLSFLARNLNKKEKAINTNNLYCVY